MKYSVKISALADSFSLPKAVGEKYLKLASEKQLKVLLKIMYDLSEEIAPEKLADALNFSVSEVEDCLVFWQQVGILAGEQEVKKEKKEPKIASLTPSRNDIIRRGLEDPALAFLLREAQLKFGRALKQNETAMLVSLYDDNDMDVSVILLLLQYAESQGKMNKTFIERTAEKWLKCGVENISDAENIIAETVKEDLAWSIVTKCFGLGNRKPSDNEAQTVKVWINDWNIGEDILNAAYNACVDAKSKFSFTYTAKIIENWHKCGVKCAEDIEKKAKKPQKGKKETSYSIELFEKMLNED